MYFPHQLNVLNSAFASTVRIWRGTSVKQAAEQPELLLELYDREGSTKCRLVREALSELNLDCMIFPCPKGGERHQARLKELSGDDRVPFLHDPNTGAKLSGIKEIVDYLFLEYTEQLAPNGDSDSLFNLLSSLLVSQVRLRQGIYAKPSRAVEEPLVLYSFESSPYSRPVRERLCELEIPYRLINLSKQQWADLGPAGFRLHLGAYKPVTGSKREKFLQEHGEVQVPFLIDPNTETELFESKVILGYLDEQYAQ